jgi:hypothetical protein
MDWLIYVWLRWHWVFALVAGVGTLPAFLLTFSQQPSSFATYYTAADLFWHKPTQFAQVYDNQWFATQIDREAFHQATDIFTPNPPTMALLALPLLGLSGQTAWWVWTMGGLLAIAGGFWLVGSVEKMPAFLLTLAFIVAIFLYAPLRHNLSHGQVYGYLLGGICLVYWGIRTKQPIAAGMTLGVMLAVKLTGIWLFILLALHKQWRILSTAILTSIVIGCISLLQLGFEPWQTFVTLLPNTLSNPKYSIFPYQTIKSLVSHLFLFDATWNQNPIAHLPWLANLLQQIGFWLPLLLTWRLGSRGKILPPPQLLYGLWISLLVTTAPQAQDYHYVLLLPAFLLAFHHTHHTKSNLFILIWLTIALGLCAMRIDFNGLQWATGWLAFLGYPRVFGAFLLWGWFLHQLRSQINAGAGIENRMTIVGGNVA